MRRNSFVAPLLLIGIGLLFLAHNIYPNLAFTEYIGKFWPWVLIAWGALRLVEIFSWNAQGRALPRSGISGGEWVVAIFVCLLGVGMHSSSGGGFPGQIQIDGANFLGDPFDFPVNAEKAAGKSPHIVLESFRGDVKVTGVNRTADSVKVSGTKSVRSLDQKEAQRLSDGATVQITGDANEMVIRPEQVQRVSYHLEISVPTGARVELRGQSGDMTVEDVAGATLVSDRSDVRLKNVAGPAQINVKRGDVHIDAARVGGQIEVSSGDVVASDVTGPLKIGARSGDVKVSGVSGEVHVDINRGDVEVSTAALGPIHLNTRSGDLHLSLPANAQFTLDASTTNGDVASDFAEVRNEAHGRNGSLHGSIGHGPNIDLHTQRGDVAVRKATSLLSKGPPEKTDKAEKIEKAIEKSIEKVEKLDQ